MRVAAVLLLLAVPGTAMAQPAPAQPAPPHPAPTKPTHPAPRPAAHPAPGHVTAPHGPAAHKPPAKPGATKPAPAKPVPPKPAPAPAPAPAAPEPQPDPRKGSNTGLPIPRFAALKTDDVNMRRGPGTRYPIEWVYKRRDLPVEIEREFEVWRLVVDPEGTKGWVHGATLTSRRTVIVAGSEHILRQAASEAAPAVAKLQKGVIVRVRGCEVKSEWCLVQTGDYRGYIKRNEVWGLLPDEVIP